MKYVLAMTALALASASSLVFAGDGSHSPRHAAYMERLKAADTNGDGLLSRSEAAALPRLADRFDAVDANRDGHPRGPTDEDAGDYRPPATSPPRHRDHHGG